MKVFEMILSEQELEFGMNIISIVDTPATDEEYIMMSEQQLENVQLASDEERQMLYGVVLQPDKKVLRIPKDGSEPYYIMFSRNTVRDVSRRFLTQGKQGNVDLEHSKEILEGVDITESWLVEDSKLDKAVALGLNVTDGDWIVGTYVSDKKLWGELKDSKKTGFSVDGVLHRKEVLKNPVDILMSAFNIK